jgi:hypothetical protein
LAGKVFLLIVLFLTNGFAEDLQKSYYSIHLASFKHLQNANRQVNSLQKKGKLVFWKKVDVPGKGEFYRVFLGKYEKRDEAVAFWERLNQEGAVNYFGIYEFKETVKSSRKTASRMPQPPLQLPEAPDFTKVSPTERFLDNQDGTVTDTRTNLMWIKNGWRLDFVSALTWQEAIKKCKNFNAGGYSDWRLSTIDEWKTLIDTSKQAPALVEPNPFENIIVHMPYWSHSEFVVADNLSVRPDLSMRAYTVMLYTGEVQHQKKNDRAFVLPVRSIK